MPRGHDSPYRDVYDNAPFAYLSVGADGLIRRVNPYAARLLGYSADQLVGRPILSLYADTAAGAPKARQLFERFLAGEAIGGEEVQVRRADGTPLWLSLTVSPICDEQGRVVASHSVAASIDRQKRAEAAMHTSEARLAALLDVVPVAIVSIDESQRIVMFNRSAEQIFGYAARDVVGDDLSVLLPAQFHASHRRQVGEFLRPSASARSMQTHIQGRRKNGEEFPAEGSIVALDVGGARLGTAAVRDLTEQRRAEAERRRLEEQLLHSRKLEAVGQLAGGVAHDFNNLLTVMIGSTDLVLDSLDADHPCRSDLDQIRHAAERASGLTRQLLAFSRRQILQPVVLDLNGLITGMSAMLRRLIEESIGIVTHLQPGLGLVLADPSQVEQVIINLAANARDAMPGGGTLTIETANVQLDDAYAHTHEGVSPGHHVMLAVSDTGAGMDADTRARVFEPFFTTKERGRGTGLGLATVYGSVKQSGGHISVYSEPGQGTTFRVYLPATGMTPESVAPRAVSSEAVPRGSETVLVVEDDNDVRRVICRVLAQHGYDVLEGDNPGAALALAERHQGAVRLLLTDVIMPQMNGRELSQRLTVLNPRMKTLFMSGYAGNVIAHRGLLDSGITFLEKPFVLADLVRRVRQVLDAGA